MGHEDNRQVVSNMRFAQFDVLHSCQDHMFCILFLLQPLQQEVHSSWHQHQPFNYLLPSRLIPVLFYPFPILFFLSKYFSDSLLNYVIVSALTVTCDKTFPFSTAVCIEKIFLCTLLVTIFSAWNDRLISTFI